ncbi:MAG: AarF/UbiB family protein [Pirellulaceae bacterium]
MRRWTEILRILSRYGLADWISRLNVDFIKDHLKDVDGQALARQSQERRIRLALTELGPTFIKLGQLLSMRPDLVGPELADELKELQSNVREDRPEYVRELIERELGRSFDELFLEFDEQPLASASIGQVHRARLLTGELVVVKVRHEKIRKKVTDDLEVLSGLATLAERIPEMAHYRPVATVAEISRMVRRELDFGREERNLLQFVARYEDDPTVCIPRPFTDYSTSSVLTMELLEGHRFTDPSRLVADGYDLEEVARRGADLFLRMIFTDGFYHADPHPGNMLLLPGNVIGLLDFGLVGRIEEGLREDIEQMLVAVSHEDVVLLASIIKRVGSVPSDLEADALEAELADFIGVYTSQPLEKISVAEALKDLMRIIHNYSIELPSQMGLLIKAMITLEGTARLISPRFRMMEVMQPFQQQAVLRRMSPRNQYRKFRRIYFGLEKLAEVLPGRTMDILDQVQRGKFDIHLEHRRLGPSVNRLVVGMVTSALFLSSALLLSNQVPPLLFAENSILGMEKVSLLGLVGFCVSSLLTVRLLRAINKSGRLDWRE